MDPVDCTYEQMLASSLRRMERAIAAVEDEEPTQLPKMLNALHAYKERHLQISAAGGPKSLKEQLEQARNAARSA